MFRKVANPLIGPFSFQKLWAEVSVVFGITSALVILIVSILFNVPLWWWWTPPLWWILNMSFQFKLREIVWKRYSKRFGTEIPSNNFFRR
jgi:hypothetical protein